MNSYEITTAVGTVVTAVTAVACMFVLRGAVARFHPGADSTVADPQRSIQRTVDDNLRYGRFAMECLVTLSVLMVGLYDVTATSASADSQKWASAIIGAVIGYWLKGSQTPVRANGNGNGNGGNGNGNSRGYGNGEKHADPSNARSGGASIAPSSRSNAGHD